MVSYNAKKQSTKRYKFMNPNMYEDLLKYCKCSRVTFKKICANTNFVRQIKNLKDKDSLTPFVVCNVFVGFAIKFFCVQSIENNTFFKYYSLQPTNKTGYIFFLARCLLAGQAELLGSKICRPYLSKIVNAIDSTSSTSWNLWTCYLKFIYSIEQILIPFSNVF